MEPARPVKSQDHPESELLAIHGVLMCNAVDCEESREVLLDGARRVHVLQHGVNLLEALLKPGLRQRLRLLVDVKDPCERSGRDQVWAMGGSVARARSEAHSRSTTEAKWPGPTASGVSAGCGMSVCSAPAAFNLGELSSASNCAINASRFLPGEAKVLRIDIAGDNGLIGIEGRRLGGLSGNSIGTTAANPRGASSMGDSFRLP